ncbi:potassium channel family protein [Eoetvoesiella caeni]|uniref:Trk system potassium uptake protein TrkA n=1 Tax=Eoetvoesiella caeni TaxID=645616 RepID=A0A366HFF8_9BURK|nr:TrkA family potassium uptake protein [Eoetvoesiella caeni]MCI2808754.1 TrkA family potassium uptake protein [Eoetvoesiella caeni]NYT55295.1 TrkA family potassium uptake protein [Eoetvoesiella caeni]RBP40723.1 trk system potassium uptake protein TrkA [Eoetvoesiella caeni]
MGQFAVIGLGRFGAAASIELMKLGHSVLGVDTDSKAVNRHVDELTHAVIADVTDKQALEELGLDNYDVVLVAIGSDLQASLLCVVHLKGLGVKNIWVKATSHAQHLILSKIGVARIVHPEEEMGIRVAQLLSYPMVNDYISIGNGEFIVEIDIGEQLNGASVGSFVASSPSALHVLLIKRKAEVIVHPDDSFVLNAKDIMVLLGHLNTLKAIAPKLT